MKTNVKLSLTRFAPVSLLALLLTFVCAQMVQAHEFIVKPVQMEAKVGSIVPFSVVSAHVFMISEEMEPLDQVSIKLIENGNTQDVKLAPNEMLMTLDGQLKPTKAGAAIVSGVRNGIIWTQTTKGWKQASKKGLTGVISSGKYEKYCKTLLTVEGSAEGFDRELGHALEIVPVDNPAAAKAGDVLTFKFLKDGKPFSPDNVTATYDGFTSTTNTYAYMTEPYGNGMAQVKVTHPGVWMVRIQAVDAQPTADYDKHVMRAVFVFEVK